METFHAHPLTFRLFLFWTGIEVDEALVERAEERLKRIHPKPNLKFIVSDLLDFNSPAWRKHVPRATILTMYFTTDAVSYTHLTLPTTAIV